ncbi:MAG: histidinol dehydrogenase, partial [Chitinophagaceae bacterium]|nr:histidinol dehydrogenase [Chitinophagaceae bacterium]
MRVIENPARSEWPQLLERPVMNLADIFSKVQPVMEAVHTGGDAAVLQYTEKFDGVVLPALAVSPEEQAAAQWQLTDALKAAIQQAAANIRTFHERQLSIPEAIETMPGVRCWRKSVGIEQVGIYIPGGTAPLFSTVLMLAIPAVLAGCKNIVLVSPPQKDGSLHPAVLYAAQ